MAAASELTVGVTVVSLTAVTETVELDLLADAAAKVAEVVAGLTA